MRAPPPFLFVVGCGRSGTTVLRTILDAHPELAVTHESKFIVPLGIRRRRYERPEGFDLDRFIHDLLADAGVRANLGLGEVWVREALATPVSDYPDAVRRIFAAYAARHHKRRYGDKMPGSVLRIPLLAELFPEARFVHIIRDGRDVALSSMAIAGLDPDPVSWALNWKARVAAGRKAGRALGPDRYHEVRYEALIDGPDDVISGVCAFLDLVHDPAMLRFFEQSDRVPAKVRSNPRHARLGEPVSAGARSWRADMPAPQLEVFEAAAGDLLTELGYPRAVPRPSRRAQARAAQGVLRWQTRRARARLPGQLRRSLGTRD
jgi:Sulfotransferase family